MRLDGWSCPAYIARFIPLVVVYPVEGRAVRTFPHVAQKRGKVVTPLATNSNASVAIIGIAGVVWVVASLFYVAPSFVLWGVSFTMFCCHTSSIVKAVFRPCALRSAVNCNSGCADIGSVATNLRPQTKCKPQFVECTSGRDSSRYRG